MKAFSILFALSFFLLSFRFPEDHSFHKEYPLEWVYFVGQLESTTGRKFGYELSFFRVEVNGVQAYPVHFAISDLEKDKFFFTDTIQRNLGDVAGHSNKKIWSLDYELRIESPTKFVLVAKPRTGNIQLDLQVSGDLTKILLHGENGISIKSRKNPKIFSHYYSFPRLNTTGSITINQESFQITKGQSWMDHEWTGNKDRIDLASSENSWDWACIQFEDGTDAVVFNFREKRNSPPETFFTIRHPGQKEKWIDSASFQPTGKTWKSQKTNKIYQISWELKNSEYRISLEPLMQNQEVNAQKSTLNSYWEGAMTAKGFWNGKTTLGKSYLELKGGVQ